MPPEKGPTPEEVVEDIKTSLGALCGDVAAVRAQQELLLGLLEEVKQLRLQNAEKDRIIMDLERRVDELEQYTRTNDVVISGTRARWPGTSGSPATRRPARWSNRWRPSSKARG